MSTEKSCQLTEDLCCKIDTGIDCVEIERFIGIQHNKSLLQKLYTEKEVHYCLSRPYPPQHFAVRFAAKEAVKKVLNQKIAMNHIEVLHEETGRPYIHLLVQTSNPVRFKLTLTHSKSVAIAHVLKFNESYGSNCHFWHGQDG